MTPQEARAIGDFLVADFEFEIPLTERVLAAAPADKTDYSPDGKGMGGLKLMRHLVVVDEWFLKSIADGAFVGGTTDETDASGIMTPADAAAKYKAVIPATLARVKALSDEQLAEELDFFGIMKLTRVQALAFALKHSIHHRGQLSTYLRSMGGKVPSIYGSSGDAEPMS